MSKKAGLVAYRRRKKNKISKPSANPPIKQDFMEEIAPAFVAYVGTRFVANIVSNIARKKFPTGGKHIAVLSSGATFLGAWTLVHRIPSLEKYHSPAVVGSAIAALQTGIQAYLPKYGWMMADVDNAKSTPALPAVEPAPSTAGELTSGVDNHDDDDALPTGDYGTLSGGNLSISDAELDGLLN